MRVIAGRLRSRRLKPVPGMNVRPTPDRLRETLFNILSARVVDSVFLDAYAGTGAVGIEALSRGARHAVLIEPRADAIAVLRENVHSLELQKETTVVRGSATALLPKFPCDIAFIDPPYSEVKEYTSAITALSATECQLVIAQHSSRLALDDSYGSLSKTRTLKQGDNSLSFFEPA